MTPDHLGSEFPSHASTPRINNWNTPHALLRLFFGVTPFNPVVNDWEDCCIEAFALVLRTWSDNVKLKGASSRPQANWHHASSMRIYVYVFVRHSSSVVGPVCILKLEGIMTPITSWCLAYSPICDLLCPKTLGLQAQSIDSDSLRLGAVALAFDRA